MSAGRAMLGAIALLTVPLALGGAAAASGAPACTIVGTGQAERLDGTPGRDVICGGGGADKIRGFAGNDRIVGGGGNDLILGGPGRDALLGQAGNDEIRGQHGNDRIFGQNGNDQLRGGSGQDLLFGQRNRDALFGENGKDRLIGGPQGDRLFGGRGADLCPGAQPIDRIRSCSYNQRRSPRRLIQPMPPCPFAPAPCGNASQRDEPPTLNSIGVSPNSADINDGPIDLDVNLSARAEGPLILVRAEIHGPDGFVERVFLDPVNSLEFEFSGSTTLAPSVPLGTYWVDRVTLVDLDRRTTDLGDADLDSGYGYGRELEVYDGPDTQSPELEELSIEPPQVNTSGAPATVTMTVKATDDLSGVERIGGAFDMPNAGLDYGFAMSRVSGAAPNGVWAYEVHLPTHAAPGEWKLDNLHLHDQAGNATDYWNHSELEAEGFPVSFIQSGPGDTTPPDILNLAITPQVMHAAKGDILTFDAHLADDLSGINPSNWGLWIEFESEDEPSFKDVATSAVRISGTDLNGVWRSARILPSDAPTGVYVVTGISTGDRAYHLTELTGASLEATGWDLTFENQP